MTDKKKAPTNRPDDLITAQEAAIMADRSKSTVRSWVRQGHLTGYRKDPKRKNSALLVSRSEVSAYLSVNGKIDPPRKQTDSELTASMERLRLHVAELEKERELNQELKKLWEAKCETMQATIQAERSRAGAEKERAESEKLRANRAEDKIVYLEKRIEQLMVYATLPWWKRWNASVPLLEG